MLAVSSERARHPERPGGPNNGVAVASAPFRGWRGGHEPERIIAERVRPAVTEGARLAQSLGVFRVRGQQRLEGARRRSVDPVRLDGLQKRGQPGPAAR